MKIAIIGFHNLHLMQFLYKYTDILDRVGVEYDVIYWDRDMDASIKYKRFNGNPIAFQYKMSNYQPKYTKIIGFLRCIRFTKKKIEEGKYDRLIFLTTQTVLPLYRIAMRYSGRYIYDYRDITFEKSTLGLKAVQSLIENSYATAMSSMGFKTVTGESNKIITAHNCSEMNFVPVLKRSCNRIRVAFWGMIRQVEFNKKICDMFGSDLRFKLVYHGEGYVDELKAYCEQKGYDIAFTGRYSSEEIEAFAADTDILLNLYENDEKQTLAMTVKFYDAVRYGLPMLVSAGSYMASVIEKNPAVYAVDMNTITADMVAEWYNRLQTREYPYTEEIASVKKDDLLFEHIVLNFIKGK